MTVADLIRELQAMPQHQAVRVVGGRTRLAEGELQLAIESGGIFEPGIWDATEADIVERCGTFVMIKGR